MIRKVLKFTAIAIVVIAVILAGAIFLSGVFRGYRMALYQETAIPYIKMVIPQMSKWEVALYKSYLWEKARRPEYDEAFNKTVSRYSKIGALRNIEEPQFLYYDGRVARGSLKVVTYSVKAHYANGDALITIKLLDTDSGFQVFHFNLESPVTNFPIPGSLAGMKKEDWLATFKPMEIKSLCADSAFKKLFKGTRDECTATVEKLLDTCANHVASVRIPDVLTSREEAGKYGSIIGECITAYHFGGEYLSLFNEVQAAQQH